MPLPQSDADVEQMVVCSRLFRACRAALVSLERVCARSTFVTLVSRPWPAGAVARVLLIASVVHAALISMVPAAAAPPGRYLLAAVGLAAAAIVGAATRRDTAA